MNNDADHRDRIAFHLNGRRADTLVAAAGLRPALLAAYRDLSALRHDFPLVLSPGDAEPVHSLRELVDAALAKVATGADADRTRRQVLRLEQALRELLAEGAEGTLSSLWTQAAQRLAPGRDASFADSAKRARAALGVDGRLQRCDAALPERVLAHVWDRAQQRKADALRKHLVRLIHGLSDILRADFALSEAGRSAAQLEASIGGPHARLFDFDAMSRLLAGAVRHTPLAPERRERIRSLLGVLDAQSFVALPDADAARAAGQEPYAYRFDSCAAALAAWHERRPRLVELSRAIAISEIELDGRYNPARHDALFERFGANGLEPGELDRFPDLLVCLDGTALDPAEQSRLMEILAGELPIKVVYRIDDLLEGPQRSADGAGPGLRGRQIAHMAMGLNQVYVLHAAASHLFRWRERIAAGMRFRGPALFCIFSGLRGGAPGQDPYLTAAAAMESRAFPAFAYDPSGGVDWASRFSLEGNPQPERDWPVHSFDYEDAQHRRVSRELAFGFADFAAGDPRMADHLAVLATAADEDDLVALDAALDEERRGLPERVPCLRMIDDADRLHTVIVDERLLREAARWREMWRSLRQLGGLQRAAVAATEPAAAAAVETAAVPAAVPAEPASAAVELAADATAPASGEAYIETARCSTCNECTQINPKMFAYNADKQAYIKDRKAGTYAQLVEAAESCQVSVIHPGEPIDPNEPGLAELVARAEAFR